MRHHDWFYAMTDNYTVFLRGEAARRRIMFKLNKLPQEEAHELWVKYAPNSMPSPFSDE
tara:strand:+ start:310 stop:486 length:177 start_codon:yes stop_codon:yes gene_type:complete